MRTKIIFSLLKKELTDIVRDKKSLMAMIGLPLILYPLMMIGMLFIMQFANEAAQSDSTTVLMQGQIPQSFKDYLNDENENNLVQFVETLSEGQENEYTLVFNDEAQAEIKYDSTIEIQGFTVSDFNELLEDYTLYLYNNALDENNIEIDIITQVVYTDTASDTQSFGMLIGQILPMLLMLGVALGIITSATDIVSGEKERKTIETLLSLPITPLEIVSSKFIAISIIGIVTALLNVFSMALSLGYVLISVTQGSSENSFFAGMDFALFVMPIIITGFAILTFTFFVSAITMAVVSMANSFKEAQNYVGPLMLLLVFPSYITMVPTFELNSITSLIPVINMSLLIKDLFNFGANIAYIFIVMASNIIYSALAIVILGKVYANENIIFGNKKSFRLIEPRNSMQKGGTPKFTDAIVLFSTGIVLFLYIGSAIGILVSTIELALAFQQILVLIMPILYAIYIKADFKNTFGLRKFKIKYLLMGIPLCAAGLALTIFLQNLLLSYFPALMQMLEVMNQTINFNNFALQVIVVCIMPAICEEMFFRGFILNALNVKKHPVMAILISSIMFGVFHMNVLQLITGIILGSVLGFITYKSKSIYPAMILHFANNFTAILLS